MRSSTFRSGLSAHATALAFTSSKRRQTDRARPVHIRPYLPLGRLRDQVLYPDTAEDARRKGVTDDRLMEIVQVNTAFHARVDMLMSVLS